MRFPKRAFISFSLLLIFVVFLSSFQLPYYIYKPGRADSLDEIVVVEDGYESEGSMHLLTVSGYHATPIKYILGKILPFHEILPIDVIRDEDETDEEYMNRQLHMMEDSQNASTIVAYEAANKPIHIQNNGVYVVSTVKKMPATEIFENGDIIKKVDDLPIETADDLVSYVSKKQKGDQIMILFEREGKEKEASIEITSFPDDESQIGIGIQLTTNLEVEVEPEVNFSSGRIGGPSAGLMFALKIYDQLVEEDLTRGYKIAGTGKIDQEGKIHPVGGVDKKVVAADRQESDVFFVPYEGGKVNSNYEEAMKAAKKIKTKMKIIPVDTFDEALSYLEELPPKKNK